MCRISNQNKMVHVFKALFIFAAATVFLTFRYIECERDVFSFSSIKQRKIRLFLTYILPFMINVMIMTSTKHSAETELLRER